MTEEECWKEVFYIYATTKELAVRAEKVHEKAKERGYVDIANYFGEDGHVPAPDLIYRP